MPKNNEIKFEDYFNLPNPGLRSYFDIVRKGQPDEYRTTFARGSSLETVLRDWKPFVDSLSDRWPTLVDFENDLAAKVGPLSIMKPLAERMEDIDHYYEGVTLPAEPIMQSANLAVIAEWAAKGSLRLRSQQRTIDLMKKSTNSGSPYFTKRRSVTAKTAFCDVEPNSQVLNLSSDPTLAGNWRPVTRDLSHQEQWDICAVLGWRGQEGGPTDEDVKQRVVWMFPYAVNIRELQVYQPLIEYAQSKDVVPAWVSMESVDNRITAMFDSKGVNDLVVCTDFSKFDQHFNSSLQTSAKTILSALFTSNAASRGWLENVFPIKYEIPLAYDYGKVRVGKHGMGSGSGGTNADETLAHRALQYEAAMKAKSRLNPNSQCLGDDGILTYPGIAVEDVVRSYTSHGLEMNPDKQYASKQDCVYLRRWHHQNYRVNGVCVGVYSTYRALGRLCEQERYFDPDIWSKEMVALRQLSIIENVKWHPLKEQFVQFCMKRDKYRLGIDIPGFLDRIDKISKEATEIMPDFLGYTKSQQKGAEKGISNWWVVKYLKSM
nr:putative RNA-dependent RNA polymerase [Picobirnavirus sp.]